MKDVAVGVAVGSVLAGVAYADDVRHFGMFEKSFSHAGAYENPYKELTATATLGRPDGTKWEMPLFWDGQAIWRLRVSPDLTGEWSYRLRSADAGLNGQSGSFRCVESKLHGSIQPMKGHPLHFQYQDGTPLWFFGDKAWRVLQTDPTKKLDHKSAMHHVDVRAEQGFNYMHTELAGTGGLASGGNEGGELFVDAGKEIINPAFFQEVDSRLHHINEKGLVFGMVVLYGKGEPYWGSLLSDEARLRFARYVAARYAAFHMVFLVSGEWQYMADKADMFRAIGREIRKTDPHGRIIGIHPGPGPYISSQEFADEDWMSFGEYAQAYFAPDKKEATDANRNDLRKFIMAARKHNKPGTGVVFLTPVKGARQIRAAKKVGLHKTKVLGALRIAGRHKPGLGAQITGALAAEGINIRGLAAFVIGRQFVAYHALDSTGDATKAAGVLKKL